MDQNCQGSVPTGTDYQREADEMLKRYQEIARVESDSKVELDEKENLASTSTRQKI